MESTILNSQAGVPVIVLTRKQDHVEAINRSLRDARHAAHCSWLSDASELADAVVQIAPELMIYFADEFPGGVATIAATRDHAAPGLPLVCVRRSVDESVIARDLDAGAQDTLSLAHARRLQAVASRELRAYRLERALNNTQRSASRYRQQLQAFMEGSADAIATVQEGIVVEANPAWLELFGYADEDAVVGQPFMDLFDTASHTALKGALVAAMQGRWEDHALRAQACTSDGSALTVELQLETVSFDGETAVQLTVPRERRVEDNPDSLVAEMVEKDPVTGLYHRRHLLEALGQRLAQTSRGGVRALVWVRPDKLLELRSGLGPLATETLLDIVAGAIAKMVGPSDLAGRMTGNAFAVFLERGTLRDCQAWTETLLSTIAGEVFEIGEQSLSLTCSAGLALAGRQVNTMDSLLDVAERCCREARARGNCLRIPEAVADDTRAMEQDRLWTRRIKAALIDNRFKLVHQPIVSLQDTHQGLYDLLVRMIDETGEEVLPGEFIPAAQRHKLMKNIDRWVIAAAIDFAISRKASRVFIRLSADSVLDDTLPKWLQHQLRNAGAPPQRLCFQLTEELCHQYLKQAKALADALRKIGCQFAVDHFGTGRDPLQVLHHLPMHYVKIDGALMQGLAGNDALQQKVSALVSAARDHKVLTIAERVEDANTMAVLFQLGVSYMQGHYVQEPEVVLEDDAPLLQTMA